MEVVAWYAFRITRYSDLEIPARGAGRSARRRSRSRCSSAGSAKSIRVEVQDDMPAHLRALLLDELREDDVPEPGRAQRARHPGRRAPARPERPDGAGAARHARRSGIRRSSPSDAARAARSGPVSIFDVIREGDLLVHHPFDSFPASVERFLEEAANDDQVLAIKLTLYRTSGDTALVRALVDAAQRGKQVAVIVELKARFDEANNITWARTARRLPACTSRSARRRSRRTRRRRSSSAASPTAFAATCTSAAATTTRSTARLYTDVGLFTCSPSIGADVSDLFNSLTGYLAPAAVSQAARGAGRTCASASSS